MNIVKTRIILLETSSPAYSYLLPSINTTFFELVGIIDTEDFPAPKEYLSYPLVSVKSLEDSSAYDLFVINDTSHRGKIMKIILAAKISSERYLFFSKDSFNLNFARTFLLPDSVAGRFVDYYYRIRGERYLSVSIEDSDFITTTRDEFIPRTMFMTKMTFSQDEINLFIELTQKYYNTSITEDCIFMDIGANIGTTSIYVKKSLLPNVKIIAFEPISENCKLLHINMMLNEITDASIFNKAVSDVSSSYTMQIKDRNYGRSCIVDEAISDINDSEKQIVDSITIEEFLEEQNIDPARVRYVWIDTEGFETEVLSGALPLLKQENVAIYMEYSPELAGAEKMEKIAEICSEHFKKYICIDDYLQGDFTPHPIIELYDLYKKSSMQTNIFLIK